jgi:DNA (cytosine-5)-methyltransferase 1
MNYLNLYACIGGNRKLLPGSVKVTAVENDPKIAAVYAKLYPLDTVIVTDAHEYLRKNYKNFDFIWASPPCPSHSIFSIATRHKNDPYPDMKLYQEIIFLQARARGFFCVENIIPYYEPLIRAKKIGRHLFWSNFKIGSGENLHPNISIMKEMNGTGGRKKAMDWLGIYFDEVLYCGNNHDPLQVFRNAVHPELGLYIYNCAMGIEKPSTQQKLF